MRRGEKAERIGVILDDLYPDPPIPLDHRDPYTLLVAVALSAQTTDKKVNQVTPALFDRAPTPAAMAALDPDEILGYIREVGLAPTKSKNLWTAANQIVDAGGEVIGFCLCELSTPEAGAIGRVAEIGVVPANRGDGLGAALLHQGFHELRRRGAERIVLDVDAENVTSAIRLYTGAGMTPQPAFTVWEKTHAAAVR